ncbi:MAG: response regulator [Lachnospiraceae bacterium]|nr:response regulator [Lachnospiraceae bacterium]
MNTNLQQILEELNIDVMDSLMAYGFIVTDLYPDYRVLYANALFLKMLGYDTLEELRERTQGRAIEIVDSSDRERVQKEGRERTGHGVYEITYHICCKNGERRLITQRSRHKVLKSGRDIIIAAYMDADEIKPLKRMQLEQEKMVLDTQAQRAEKKFRIALENSNLFIWECYFEEKKNVYTSRTMARLHTPRVVCNVPEGLIESGRIAPESAEEVRRMYAAVMSGEPKAEGIVKLQLEEGGQWLKISMTTFYDSNGIPESAVCMAEDVTSERNLLRKMEDEMERRSFYETDLQDKGYFDLTEDRIIDYESTGAMEEQKGEHKSYSDAMLAMAARIRGDEKREEFKTVFAVSNLRRLMDSGITEMHFEYSRGNAGGDVTWVDSHIHMMYGPGNGHILAFLYTTDVNERKRTQDILNAVANDNYDGIILIHISTGAYYSFTKADRKILKIPSEGENYWEDLDVSLRDCLSEEDYQEARRTRTPEYITGILEKDKKCVFISKISGADGSSKIMRMQYSYLNEEQQDILATGINITAAVKEEKMQKDALESALLAARQASSAKSSFLSRMSHEIRTPLNAILGMVALAAQSGGNEEEIQDCISKIGISGHYLLSLINDILDMSRIESGKMLLRNEPFDFADFVDSVNTVIYSQCNQKGINYEMVTAHGLDDGYIGDAMKLQQILINVLGNAVKFTEPGGKITFSISSVLRHHTTDRLRFAISDTGCGIAKEDMERIFEAFEQKDGTTTSIYGGSGLGLAISRNLVELMGGTIRVHSIVDVGSEFVIELPFTIDPALVRKYPSEYSFANLKTLVVDDDILVCEQTSKTLQDIGMIPEYVTSGEKAVERVAELWNRQMSFDFILVDWKMPDMDGLETSRCIRRIVGADVTIIIMTAYDWASIEREAQAAGVNMCISKPMLKSTLVSAFTKANGEAIHEQMAKQEPEFDFSGRRILLAEDHPLNAEIATRLLQKKKCTVETAENGLKALEKFSRSAVGYYDAILMDIRMPMMDGLQATTNIRHWDKADAKTIPIIAMTANAFDEDIEKSKAVGMDAHLAKPIVPELLYRVLYRLMS